MSSVESPSKGEPSAERALQAKTAQLQAIGDAMTQFLDDGNWRAASGTLLREALRQTASEYGFIGVVADGPVLRVLAHEGIVWDRTVNRAFYEQAVRTYQEVGHLEFTNFKNLFGHVITTGEAVVSNDPATDPRSGGLPPGHPPLRHFLGVPLLRGAQVVGMIGVANRQGGYTGTEQAAIELLAQAVGVLYDSYRRQQREASLEAQLREAHKLEAVGRLAGGIAHDFNNLLTVINGYSAFLAEALKPDSPLRRYADEVVKAGERAATLTDQLLAFSRRQVVQPTVLDLNGVVADMASMLRRLLGETIELRTALASEGAFVKADPGQLGQALMNLAVNARDAMPAGGSLTITTAVRQADQADPRGLPPEPDGRPRPCIVLTVEDTGTGMDSATQAHIFEPFFTTKPIGKGTGLGLSTVYGIVKQSGGTITVDSRPGQGTTFAIALPQADPEAAARAATEVPTTPSGRGEVILLVEDADAVRTLAHRVLAREGYRVLEAQNGAEALARCRTETGPIHLLVTDVIMPGMTGRKLAELATALRPEMKVLYMSGYTDDILAPAGVLAAGQAFLQKPFRREALARKVREALAN